MRLSVASVVFVSSAFLWRGRADKVFQKNTTRRRRRGDFFENRRLDLVCPPVPGATFALGERNEGCDVKERRKMEVNEKRGGFILENQSAIALLFTKKRKSPSYKNGRNCQTRYGSNSCEENKA